ncbi:MAG: type VI secretion system baseplate subunit TssK [Melioribacteraceae bacterium]
MAKYQKVIWHEGMKLDPHHFQQSDRFFQYSLNKRMDSVYINNWGFSELQIDTASLANGNFSLVNCSGVMPDGLCFDFPENESIPNTRQFVNLFEATAEKLEVFLAIPLELLTGNNCQLENLSENRLTRYTIQMLEVLDDNIGTNHRQVGMARPNFSIKLGGENYEEFNVLQIGEIKRSSDGTFYMDKDFIPPVLKISASESMMKCVREILGGLTTKSKELKSQQNPHKREISITDVEILLLLQTINTYIPIINQYYNTPHYHPEIIYSSLLSLSGQLVTLTTDSGISSIDLQPYNHKNLSGVVHHIYNQIMTFLNIQKKISKLYTIIPLNKQNDSLSAAGLSQKQIDSQLFIVVKSNMPEEKIISEFPNNIKVAAHEEILAVHQAGLQGVNIEYISRPPSGLSVDPENHYFKIRKEGRLWEKIIEKQSIAIFLATKFNQVELQLISFLSEK